eukprot:Gb_19050 [translate_table: standard]
MSTPFSVSLQSKPHGFGLWSSNADGCQSFNPSDIDKPKSLKFKGTALEVRAVSQSEQPNQQPVSQMKSISASLTSLQHLKDSSAADRYTREKSCIAVVGLSVHTASVEMREKMAIPEADWPRAIGELCKFPHIQEAAVLSTCNRMEIYIVALSWQRGIHEVMEWMSKTSGVALEQFRDHLFILRNRDASQHLFKVASGLDSLVLGEGQILAQVKHVSKTGQGVEGFGKNLTGLFNHAVTAGKRVRSQTSIGAGAVSVSSAAVELAAMKLLNGNISSANVVVIGAGKMGGIVIKHLIAKGCKRIVVVNRSEERVLSLVQEINDPNVELVYKPVSQMHACASEAEVVFTSTGSQTPLFLKDDVENLPPVTSELGGTRIFIDIGVPRNVGACVSELDSVRVYNVDDMNEVVKANKEERCRRAMEAEGIIDEELKQFEAWQNSLETVPTIKKLRAYAERTRIAEVEKYLAKMGLDMSPKNKKIVDDLTRSIVNKLLHGPMQHLRCDGSSERSLNETLENMHTLERIFELEKEESAIVDKKARAKVDQSQE